MRATHTDAGKGRAVPGCDGLTPQAGADTDTGQAPHRFSIPAMDILTLLLFSLILLSCLAMKASVLWALAAGFLIFLAHGRVRGHAWGIMLRMALASAWRVRTILAAFALIGALTALWRASGTIPMLMCCASPLFSPSCFTLSVFLFNAAVSILIGSSFATAATAGVVCASLSHAMGADILLTGGAVLAGAYVGDRWSPVSTSALLVAEITGTSVFGNLGRMARTSAVPLAVSCMVYAILGRFFPPAAADAMDLHARFTAHFDLHGLCLAPAIVLLLLAALRFPVKSAMTASIAAAVPLALFQQGAGPADIIRAVLLGYHSPVPAMAGMLNGGGIVSMLKVMGIVCLSASYGGLLQETGLLDGAQRSLGALSKRVSRYAATLCASLMTGTVTSNQTLSIMLTAQLCMLTYRNGGNSPAAMEDLALDLEDSAVVTTALFPWSIACSVPLSATGAPDAAISCAFFLYLLPLWRLVWTPSGKSPCRRQIPR